MVQDNIADMLTRMRNALQMRYETVEVNGTKMTLGIAEILKKEGFIRTDRRLGAFVADNIDMNKDFCEKLEAELELLSAEACITGMDKETFLNMCSEVYSRMNPCTA